MYFFGDIIQPILFRMGYYSYRFKHGWKKYRVDDEWLARTNDSVASSDNDFIPRDERAGMVENSIQYLHNGIRIRLGSYYGFGYAYLLQKNRGVHEPQEERVFQEVLKYIPKGSAMLELGSFWAFYSLWFNKQIENAVNYMVEPDLLSLLKGKENFRLNGLKGCFIQAFVGSKPSEQAKLKVVTVDDFLKEKGLNRLAILHADIQGYEYAMLQGSVESLKAKKIDYVFISTHSNILHEDCRNFLKSFDYQVIADINLDDTFSVDGLLVVKRPGVAYPEPVALSRRSKI